MARFGRAVPPGGHLLHIVATATALGAGGTAAVVTGGSATGTLSSTGTAAVVVGGSAVGTGAGNASAVLLVVTRAAVQRAALLRRRPTATQYLAATVDVTTLSSTGTAAVVVAGSGVGTLRSTGTAAVVVGGSAVGGGTLTGSGTAAVVVAGSAVGTLRSTATGAVTAGGSAVGTLASTATALVHVSGSATGSVGPVVAGGWIGGVLLAAPRVAGVLEVRARHTAVLTGDD